MYPGTPLSITNTTDRHDITEILFKVELKTMTLTSSTEYIKTVLVVWRTIFFCAFRIDELNTTYVLLLLYSNVLGINS